MSECQQAPCEHLDHALDCRCGHPDDDHGMWGCWHAGCSCGRFEAALIDGSEIPT